MSLHYVARKRMKVASRTVEPGEVVPEAATWKNVKAYVDGGALAVALEVPEGAVENAELKGQVAALAERVAALEGLIAGAGEQEGDVEVIDEPDGEDGSDTDPDIPVEPLDLDNLKGISREEIDARAVALGIEDAPKLGSKGAVATAINEVIAKREAQP